MPGVVPVDSITVCQRSSNPVSYTHLDVYKRQAQGVAIAAALNRQIPVTEYAPRKIKQAITGNGNAAKEQVSAMLQRILSIPDEEMPEKMDATDGLAAAVCHHYQSSSLLAGRKGHSGWKSFLKDNPDRIR